MAKILENRKPSDWWNDKLRDHQKRRTRMFRDYWAKREKIRCEGGCMTCCDRPESNHDKHAAKTLPYDFDKPCLIKQNSPKHMQYRQPENMGMADPHYVANRTISMRRSKVSKDICYHGDDYETDSDDEEEEFEYVAAVSDWAQGHVMRLKPFLPGFISFFVLWLFTMNYAIFGSAPATTDK